jgi:acyl-coenzyme A synthetase/AMP-(fatty) acid ligase
VQGAFTRYPPMSTWSVFSARQPESVVFVSSAGAVTRAGLEAHMRRRVREAGSGAELAAAGEPVGLLVDLLAAWNCGCAMVLGAQGDRDRRRVEAVASASPSTEITLDRQFDSERILLELSTSGTTGTPVRHGKTAAQLLGEAQVQGPLFGLSPDSVVLSTVPLHHLYGLLFGLLAPLAAGARIISDPAGDPSKFHPHRLAGAAQEHGVTHLVTVPAHIRSLLDAGVVLPGVREVVSSAAALPVAWARHFEEQSGARLIDVLGSTESGGVAYRRTARDTSYRPLPGVVARATEDGHLEVVSPFAGSREPLATGDRVELLADGTFVHLGRDDGVVKVGGKRLLLHDLEAAALGIAGVTDALALARPTTRARGSEIWLVVAAGGIDRTALRQALTGAVEPLLLPRRLCVWPRLPRDARGKLAKATIERLLFLPGFDVLALELEPLCVTLRLRVDSPRLDGHFPKAPVLPAASQLLDLIVPEVERLAGRPVTSARRLKWTRPILPGDVFTLTLELAEPGRYRFRVSGSGEVAISTGVLDTAPQA